MNPSIKITLVNDCGLDRIIEDMASDRLQTNDSTYLHTARFCYGLWGQRCDKGFHWFQ